MWPGWSDIYWTRAEHEAVIWVGHVASSNNTDVECWFCTNICFFKEVATLFRFLLILSFCSKLQVRVFAVRCSQHCYGLMYFHKLCSLKFWLVRLAFLVIKSMCCRHGCRIGWRLYNKMICLIYTILGCGNLQALVPKNLLLIRAAWHSRWMLPKNISPMFSKAFYVKYPFKAQRSFVAST